MTDPRNEGVPCEAPVPKLVLIGARSNAGRAILRAWPAGTVTSVHRGGGEGVVVADYGSVPPDVISPGCVVVNCVGTPTGSDEALLRLNRDVPLRWAEAAAAAGAEHFIQLSSFSVYGRAERIAPGTPEAPRAAYGRSKLAADRALLAMDSTGMTVTALRIPMLFGSSNDKLATLVKATLRIGAVPSINPPIERSMLSYDALGAAIAQTAGRSIGGAVNIADPTAFTYELLRDRIAGATGRRLRRIPVPRLAIAASRWLAAPVHDRLFASSLLEPSAALSFEMPDSATLGPEIERLAKLHSQTGSAG